MTTRQAWLATFRRRWPRLRWPAMAGPAVVVAVLAGASVAWAALPMRGASIGARPMLIVASCCGALAVAQLGTRMLAWRQRSVQRDDTYEPALVELMRQAWSACMLAPWPEVMLVAVLVLEALHRSRPWHTAVLGVGLLACLLALHLAESAARTSALKPQRPLIAAGVGLAAISAGATLLPDAGSGAGWLAVIAAVAAVIAAALALPR